MKSKIFLFVAIFILSLSVVSATQIDFSHECELDCVKGEDITFNVNLFVSKDDYNKNVKEVFIKEVVSGAKIAFHNPQDGFVSSGDNKDFSFYGMLDSDSELFEVNYKACLIVEEISETNIKLNESEICSEEVNSFQILSPEQVSCMFDGECAQDEYCNKDEKKCELVLCPFPDRIIHDHECVEFGCSVLEDPVNKTCQINMLRFIFVVIMLSLLVVIITYLFLSNRVEYVIKQPEQKKLKRKK